MRMRAKSSSRFWVTRAHVVLVGAILALACAGNDPAVTTIDVALTAGEVYEYPTVGGDEEGARIVTQAQHFAVSEIRRDATTNWVAVYVYQPGAGYSGADGTEIEVNAGSDGAGPGHLTRIVFRFTIAQ